MNMILRFTLLSFVLIMWACSNPGEKTDHAHHEHDHHGHAHDHGHANEHMNENDFQDLVDRFESEERTEYQQPDLVLDTLGPFEGLKVMEIGAGTGYFSFRMADRGAKVIAADVDDRFQEYIRNKRDSLGISEEDISLRKVPYDDPKLDSAEVDMVLVVNTYHHIENRSDYFSKVLRGLRPGGKLVVIDFKKEKMSVGPPIQMKLNPSQVSRELKAAGFKKVNSDSRLLKYQYIITAQP
jgi:ubiquinone/menaquinone biosynthesis C-methylase UbiE